MRQLAWFAPPLSVGCLALGACEPEAPAPREPATAPSEPAAPAYDPVAAHREAFTSARPQLLALAEALEPLGFPLTSPERTKLDELLRAGNRAAEGIDHSQLDAKSRSEVLAFGLLRRRANALLQSTTAGRVDAQRANRSLRRALVCAEAGLAQKGAIDASCAVGWHRAVKGVGSLQASSIVALESAREDAKALCSRVAALAELPAWKAWASAELTRCETLQSQLSKLALDTAEDPTPEAWATSRLGSTPAEGLLAATDLPPTKELVRWFDLSSGWDGPQQQPAQRGQRGIIALQVRGAAAASSGKGAPFSPEACAKHLQAFAALGRQSPGALSCENFAAAAGGQRFTPDEQAAWTLRRGYLDFSTMTHAGADDALTYLRSPVNPVLDQLQLDLLERAGFNQAAKATRAKLVERMCASMTLASVMAGGEAKAPSSCPKGALEAAQRDPLGALEDLELAFLDLSAALPKTLLNGPWLPLGWRALASETETETPAVPSDRPVAVETELPMELPEPNNP